MPSGSLAGPVAVTGVGGFWPARTDRLARLAAASDRKLVPVDLRVAPSS